MHDKYCHNANVPEENLISLLTRLCSWQVFGKFTKTCS